MLYEHHSQPVISGAAWLLRLVKFLQLAAAVLAAFLLSGFILLTSAGIVMAPILHRFLHHFHKANGQRS